MQHPFFINAIILYATTNFSSQKNSKYPYVPDNWLGTITTAKGEWETETGEKVEGKKIPCLNSLLNISFTLVEIAVEKKN